MIIRVLLASEKTVENLNAPLFFQGFGCCCVPGIRLVNKTSPRPGVSDISFFFHGGSQLGKGFGGDLKKTIMVEDSEVDSNSAINAKLPFVLVKDGYTEKSAKEIKHDELISDFVGFEKIIQKYL